MKKKSSQLKQKIIIGVIFIFGLGVFLYPNLSNIYAEYTQALTIWDYRKEQEKMDEQLKELELERLREYNESLTEGSIEYVDPFTENDEVGESNDEQPYVDERLGNPVGHIEVPKIGINIPIFNGTTDYILQRGIGLLGNSSMPVGGESTHSALTGHRGLPNAELFTNIVDLVEGDIFYIHSLAGILAYQIESIETVLPYETESLRIQEGRDLVTLITCTPYMINTHRILITGTRIPYEAPQKEQIKTPVSRKIIEHVVEQEQSIWTYIAGIALAFILIILLILFIKRKRRGGKQDEK